MTRSAPFDYARASALMDELGIDLVLVCSRANVGYLSDHVYHTAQGLITDDGCESLTSFPRDLLVFGQA